MDKQALMQHGVFSWNQLQTIDTSAAKAFYGELFGWQLSDEQAGETTYTIIKAGDREVGGITASAPGGNHAPAWGAYVTVDDVDKQIVRAEQLGGKIVVPPRDIPNVGRFAVINDPQGAMLSLISYTAQG